MSIEKHIRDPMARERSQLRADEAKEAINNNAFFSFSSHFFSKIIYYYYYYFIHA